VAGHSDVQWGGAALYSIKYGECAAAPSWHLILPRCCRSESAATWLDIVEQADVQWGGAALYSIKYGECAAAPSWHFDTSAPLQIGICSHRIAKTLTGTMRQSPRSEAIYS